MTDSTDDDRTMPIREIAVRETEKEPRFGLSPSQVVATALAAVTATFAASYLGVAGTLIGAAVSSVVSVVGGSIYTRSLDRTQESLRRVPVRRTGTAATAVQPAATESGRAQPAARASLGQPMTQHTQVIDLPTGPGVSDPRTWQERLPWRPLVLASLGIFVIVISAVVGFELLTGQPVSATVRGESGSGTTFTPERGDAATTVPDPAQSATPTPTGGESRAPSTSSSPSSSSSPSTSPSPSQSPSSTATPGPEPTGGIPSPSTAPGGAGEAASGSQP